MTDVDVLMNAPLVGFAGDWHGNTGWALQSLRHFSDLGVKVAYQLGDFGVWGGQDGASYLRKIQRTLDEHDQLLLVIPGNHENYDMLDHMPVNEHGWMCRSQAEPRIWYAPRGHVWTHQHVRFAAMGGAGSIDRNLRKPGTSWWAQEEITQSDVDSLIANMELMGWDNVDVMLTHDSPAGISIPVGQDPSWLTPEVKHACWSQRVLLRDAVDVASPAWILHGHWHRLLREQLEGVGLSSCAPYMASVVGLNMEGPGNLATATLTPIVGLTSLQIL